jgi:arylsulfatase A-like enzyme
VKTIALHIVIFISMFPLIGMAQKMAQRPNVILIVSDDGGYQDFGCYGGTEIPTPNIDLLARNGIRFTQAYVSASVCAPSRAGMITGKYQQRFGFEHNPSNLPAKGFTKEDVGIDLSVKTIADQFKANGYATIAIGKWHLGAEEKYHPQNRGFDHFYGFLGGHRDYFGYKKPAGKEVVLWDDGKAVPEDQATYTTEMFTSRARDYVRANKNQPFFMYLAYNAIHTPMQGLDSLEKEFSFIKDKDRRAFAAMMKCMDTGISQLMDELKKQGIYNNTLIFFINDNGAATNNAADNGSLRGLKGSKFEGGIRVPFIMQWPGKITAGTTYHKMVSSLDILPTALAAINGRPVKNQVLDGKNLLYYISNKSKTPHQDLFWRRGIAAAVHSGKWKLIRSGSNPVLLFDLDHDIKESANLATRYPKVVKTLLGKLEHWEKGLEQPRWTSSYGDTNQLMKHRMEVTGREMERQYP